MAASMTKEIWAALSVVMNKCPRVLLYGPPGTGKTHLAETEGFRTPDQSYYSITLTEDTPASELRGHFVPKGQEFVWHDGPAVRAWREGARLIVNEVDRASQDVWSFLLSILDDPTVAAETLPTGELVKPTEGFHAIGTMNGEPHELTEALADRFAVRVKISEPNPAALKRLSTPSLRKAAHIAASNPNFDQRIGLRRWFAYDALTQHLSADMAGFFVFGERAPEIVRSLKVADAT